MTVEAIGVGGPQWVPRYCAWELTLKCNMCCIHCGSSAGSSRRRELDLDECLQVADELADLGCEQVSLIGGEVLLFKDWEKIARRLTSGGVATNIITNALLLDPAAIRKIEEAGLANVGISLDGMETNHDFIRQSAGAFRKVLAAFEALRDAGISIAVVTCLMGRNEGDMEALYDLLLEYGVAVWQLQLATPMGNMARHRDILFDRDRIPAITRFIKEKRRERKINIYAGDDIGYYDANELYIRGIPGAFASWSGCQAGLSVVGIDSAGNVKGCESLYSDEFIEGNLRESTLRRIWTKPGSFSYNREFTTDKLEGACKGCENGAVCRAGCRSSCFFTTKCLFDNPYCRLHG